MVSLPNNFCKSRINAKMFSLRLIFANSNTGLYIYVLSYRTVRAESRSWLRVVEIALRSMLATFVGENASEDVGSRDAGGLRVTFQLQDRHVSVLSRSSVNVCILLLSDRATLKAWN